VEDERGAEPTTLLMHVFISLSLYVYMYIYIYIEREREKVLQHAARVPEVGRTGEGLSTLLS